MCNWDAGGHEETEYHHLPRIPATHPHLKTLPMCWYVACILIGKDVEYEKKTEKRMRKFRTQCAMALRLPIRTWHNEQENQ